VLGNTERALRTVAFGGTSDSWLSAKVRKAVQIPEKDGFGHIYSRLADACGALAEIRACGYLRLCGLEVVPRSGKGFDLTACTGSDPVAVEISAVLMTQCEAQTLFDFHNRRSSYCDEVVIHPAGAPKEGEFTVDNIVHKFSQKAEEENRQLPADRPALLWLDVQFEDWWSLSADEAWPLYVLPNGRFRTGGVWLGIYGRKGTPLLESESMSKGFPPQGQEAVHTTLRYPGYFAKQDVHASAVVIAWPESTVIFENPDACQRIPSQVLERLLCLPHFDWPRSWMRPFWQHDADQAVAELRSRVKRMRDQIDQLSQFVRLNW
jgi:hypothetical protein